VILGTNQRLANALVVVTRSGFASASEGSDDRAAANPSKPLRITGNNLAPASERARGRGRRRKSFSPQYSSRTFEFSMAVRSMVRDPFGVDASIMPWLIQTPCAEHIDGSTPKPERDATLPMPLAGIKKMASSTIVGRR
jgi:hypothetical protein